MNLDNKERFNALDIHDWQIMETSIRQNNSGDWSLTLTLGMKSTEHRLVFSNCRSVRTNIHGGRVGRDTVDQWGTSIDSEFYRKANSWPSALKQGTLHYSLSTSSGSIVDVVAEGFDFHPI